MSDNADRQWVVPPPGEGQVAFHFAVGEGVQLTSEQEAAVSALLRSLEGGDPEVTGHVLSAKCPKEGSCSTFKCTSMDCGNLKCGTLSAVTRGGASTWNIMGTFGGVK